MAEDDNVGIRYDSVALLVMHCSIGISYDSKAVLVSGMGDAVTQLD